MSNSTSEKQSITSCKSLHISSISLKEKHKNRVSRYKEKEFKVILCPEIPGHIYKIETFSKDSENNDDIVKETLIYQGIKSNKQLREDYKKKKEQI